MDLLTYLRLYEPENLVKVHGNVYCTREHDSLKISTSKSQMVNGCGGQGTLAEHQRSIILSRLKA